MEGNIKPKTPILGEKSEIYEKTLMANPELILPLMLMSGLLGDIPTEEEETVPEIIIPKSKFTASEILVLPALLMTGLAEFVVPKTKLMDIKMVFGPTLFMAGIIGNSIIKPVDKIEPVSEKVVVEELKKTNKKYKRTTPEEGNKKLLYSNFLDRTSKFISEVINFLSKYNKNSLDRINWKKKNLEQEQLSSTEKNVRSKDLVKKSQKTESPIKKGLQKFFGSKGASSSTIIAGTTLAAATAAGAAAASTTGGTEISRDVLSGARIPVMTKEGFVGVPAWVPFPPNTQGLAFTSWYGFLPSRGREHKGIDIGGREGTPIITPISGMVTYARFNDGGYGNLVEITKNNVTMLFAHLNRIDVREGSQVVAGTKIGTLGNTGRSRGAHLHWEIKVNGQYVSPVEWTKQNSPEISSPALGQSPSANQPQGTFRSKGLIILAGHNDVISGETGTNGPPGSRSISRGETNEQYMNRMVAQALQNAGIGTYIPSIKTPGKDDPNSNWTVGKRYARDGYSVVEIHYDAATGGRSGLIVPTNRPLSNVEKALARDFGTFPFKYRDLGAPNRGISILEVAPLTAERIRNPRQAIQNDVQRIIRSIRSVRTQSDGGVTKLAKILVGEAGPEFVIPMSKMKNFMKLMTVEKIKTLQSTYSRSNNFTQVNVNKINSTEQSVNYQNGLIYDMFNGTEENVTYYYQPTVYYS